MIIGTLYGNGTVKDNLYKDIKDEFKIDFNAWETYFYKDSLMIRFSRNDILYKKAEPGLNRSFEIILKDFSPRFIDILSRYKDQISQVTVKGHTSSDNSFAKSVEEKFEKNLELSQKRADMVLEYIENLSDERIVNNLPWIENTFSAEGLSFLEPILNTQTVKKTKSCPKEQKSL